MSYRAVIFDLDDTLIDDSGSFQRSVQATADYVAAEQPHVSAAALCDAYFRASDDVWTDFERQQRAGLESQENTGAILRRECWSRALRAVGVSNKVLLDAVIATYARCRAEHIFPFPETREVLRELSEYATTGIITNGTSDTQREKLQRAGLVEEVDYCIVAEEFGLGKPDPAIFLHVAEKLGALPGECAMVGDRLDSDITGANGAGMTSIWINRGRATAPTAAPKPDFIVTDLRQTIQVLSLTRPRT